MNIKVPDNRVKNDRKFSVGNTLNDIVDNIPAARSVSRRIINSAIPACVNFAVTSFRRNASFRTRLWYSTPFLRQVVRDLISRFEENKKMMIETNKINTANNYSYKILLNLF